MSFRVLSGAVLLCLASWTSAGELHEVILVDHAFEPAELTIHAGDTVRWTNQGSHPHNVLADDGSFRCAEGCDGPNPGSYHDGNGNSPGDPSAGSWSFTRQFNEPGEIGYHCETHGIPGVGMAGTITVLAADDPPEDPEFAINFGLTGAWFYPPTAGQGFVFDVIPAADPPVFVAYWFTFATESGGPEAQRWLYAQGEFEWGDGSVELEVQQVTEGIFDDPRDESREVIGVALVEFESCTDATVTYNLDFDGDEDANVAGSTPIQRLSPDVMCEELIAEQEGGD